jgi:ATP-dependent RNA helicase DDX51/DBP6
MCPWESTEDAKRVPAASGRSAPVLPWMRVPVVVDPEDGTPLEGVRGLDHRLTAALHAQSIHALFPVQTVVWEATAGGASSLHDICLSAPTGSGKTLAYALPIIQALSCGQPSSSKARVVRALLVLPTRDLAMQVYRVIEPLCRTVSLTTVAAAGAVPLLAEAGMLLHADIAVVTPGRLVAHAQSTPGFDLTRLEFLVVDEADRLLRQGYQNWLAKVLTAIRSRANQGRTSPSPPTLKFVVSATLTKDPSKLDRLELRYPRCVAMAAGNVVPMLS